MKKVAVNIAVVAFVCFATFFAVTATMYAVFGWNDGAWTDGASKVLVIVSDLIAAALAVFLLYATFSQRAAVKRLLLYCDSESVTTADIKVVKNVINGCARHVEGVKVSKVRIAADDKQGFTLTLHVLAEGTSVQRNLDKLRCLLTTAFAETLGVKFNSVNFAVDKLTTHYSPDLPAAEMQAETIADGRKQADEFYEDPLGKCDGSDENSNAHVQAEDVDVAHTLDEASTQNSTTNA